MSVSVYTVLGGVRVGHFPSICVDESTSILTFDLNMENAHRTFGKTFGFLWFECGFFLK